MSLLAFLATIAKLTTLAALQKLAIHQIPFGLEAIGAQLLPQIVMGCSWRRNETSKCRQRCSLDIRANWFHDFFSIKATSSSRWGCGSGSLRAYSFKLRRDCRSKLMVFLSEGRGTKQWINSRKNLVKSSTERCDTSPLLNHSNILWNTSFELPSDCRKFLASTLAGSARRNRTMNV